MKILITHVNSLKERTRPTKFSYFWAMKHLVILAALLPEPNSTAAGKRMLQLIGLFQEENYKISFLYTAAKSEYSQDLKALGIQEIQVKINDSAFDELLQELNPSVVLFDRFMVEEQFGWRVHKFVPNALTLLDTEDLHFLRKAREKAFLKQESLSDSDLQSDVFFREMASILRCDLSLVISKVEFELLTSQFQVDPSLLCYLPLFAQKEANSPGFHERQDFISIGNFLHPPNYHTVLELKKAWPEIKKQIPEASLLIYGAYPTDKLKPLHDETQGFLLKGRAENLKEVLFKARVLAAPIPYGAGLKGKLLDAMSHGLPSVTSPIGAEGIQKDGEWNGFITDSPKDFVTQSILLYTNSAVWTTSQQTGDKILSSKFERDIFQSSFATRVQQQLENLTSHREKNYLSRLLQHHTMQSTKYLSRWIEEKNKHLEKN
ncbi:glycosyltransferase [Chryseobacterium sp. A301]